MVIKETPPPKREYLIAVDEEELEFLLECSYMAYSHSNEGHREFFTRVWKTISAVLPTTRRFWVRNSSSLENIVRPSTYKKVE